MKWTEQQHPGESMIAWGAPAMLAAASGWAAYALSGAMLAGIGGSATVFALGTLAMARVGAGERGLRIPDFAVEPVDAAALNELLLDDPLRDVAADSRVVSLFAPQIETAGALVARIADYLGERSPQARAAEDHAAGPVAGDAGAALHVALANIRASLR